MFLINEDKTLTPGTGKNLSILKQPVLSVVNEHLIAYPVPSNLNYFWGFGSLAGISLVIQIATGVFLACHYTPDVNLAFSSVEHIMRDTRRVFIALHARQWCKYVFYGNYGTYFARSLLWIVPSPKRSRLVYWSTYSVFNDCNSFHGLQSTLRSAEFMGN